MSKKQSPPGVNRTFIRTPSSYLFRSCAGPKRVRSTSINQAVPVEASRKKINKSPSSFITIIKTRLVFPRPRVTEGRVRRIHLSRRVLDASRFLSRLMVSLYSIQAYTLHPIDRSTNGSVTANRKPPILRLVAAISGCKWRYKSCAFRLVFHRSRKS